MPKKPSPEAMREALGSFIEIDRPATLQVLDRTAVQQSALCPFLAACNIAGKLNISQAAHIGEEVHQAFGRATRAYIECNGDIYPGQLKDLLVSELQASRPDIQPEVISAAAASAWHWACYIKELNPSNILAFDGGEDMGKGGQLACDFEDLGVSYTSELDFLCAGPSPKLLHEVDYKSGHGLHTARSVAADFQFQSHALLVFANYPDVDGLEVVAWNTRTNKPTYPVIFERAKSQQYVSRVRMGIQHYMTSVLPYDLDDPENQPPCWPTAEKCIGCDAAFLCPEAGSPIREVAADPVAALRQYVVLDQKMDKLSKALASHADKHGDIADGSVRFGRNKPKSERKSPAALYSLANQEETNGDGN